MSFRQAIRPLRTKEVKHIQGLCEAQFGTTFDTECAFFIHEKHRDVYLITRDIEEVPYEDLRVNNVGLYIAQLSSDNNSLRLSIEGAQLLTDANKHIIVIDDTLTKTYLFGDDIPVDQTENGWYIVRTSKDVLGCGLIKDGLLVNHTPKGRRISSKE